MGAGTLQLGDTESLTCFRNRRTLRTFRPTCPAISAIVLPRHLISRIWRPVASRRTESSFHLLLAGLTLPPLTSRRHRVRLQVLGLGGRRGIALLLQPIRVNEE